LGSGGASWYESTLPHPSATPTPGRGPKQRTRRRAGLPIGHLEEAEGGEARVATPTLMHSSYATGSPLHNEGSSTSTNTKTNGSLQAKIETPKKEDRKRTGPPWSVSGAEAEPRG